MLPKSSNRTRSKARFLGWFRPSRGPKKQASAPATPSFQDSVARGPVGNAGQPTEPDGQRDEESATDEDDEEDNSPVASPLPSSTAKPRDLWNEAWEALDKQVKDLLKPLSKPDATGVMYQDKRLEAKQMDNIMNNAQRKLEDYRKQWDEHAKNQDAQPGISSVSNLVTSILTVKELIDAGVKFDPTGYSSSAWAVVSFGLTVSNIQTCGATSLLIHLFRFSLWTTISVGRRWHSLQVNSSLTSLPDISGLQTIIAIRLLQQDPETKVRISRMPLWPCTLPFSTTRPKFKRPSRNRV